MSNSSFCRVAISWLVLDKLLFHQEITCTLVNCNCLSLSSNNMGFVYWQILHFGIIPQFSFKSQYWIG